MTEQQTNHPLAESLSALVDNQASELELQRILKTSQSDPEVKATWARYQLASAAIRGELPALQVTDLQITDFSARVSAALNEEPEQSSTPQVQKKPHWWQNTARFAVAASVAGGIILFAQNPGGISQTPELMAETSVTQPASAAAIPSGYHGQPLSLRTVGMQQGLEGRQQEHRQVVFVPRQATNASALPKPSPEAQEELREYLNQLIEVHTDNAALNSSQGMLPFARVIFIDEE